MRSLITATQIDDFFNGRNRDAQELLPELIRRLVTATASRDNLMDCHIPVHNEIGQPGLDGQIELRAAVYPLPAGKCFMEAGTDRTPKTKADGDYKKRIDAPKEEYKSGTFLFITPRCWPTKDDWCSEKAKDAFFAKIIVLDSTDLESWLGYCPAVTKWLLRQIGMVQTEILDHDEFFRKEVLSKYNEKIVPKLLTEKFSREGGEEPIDAFIHWLKSEQKIITVFAPSSEEAVLFIAGSFMRLPDDIKEYIQNRVLFIYDSSILPLFEKDSDLILVVMDRRLLREIKSSDFPKIRCICPESKQINPNTINGRALTIERMARDQVEAALMEMGYSDERAYPLATESHGSLTAVLWMISNAENTAPKWNERDDIYELLPLLMLGQWNTNSIDDKQIVEKICAKSYAEIEIIIDKWSNERGGPLIHRGAYVDWLAWDYCWALLSSQIPDTLFNNYFDVAADVLGAIDPVADIPVDERWYSFERLPYSASLRKGICATAANISSANDTKRYMADNLVRKLLLPDTVQKRTYAWFSLSSHLAALAEISPSVFLAALEQIIEDKVPIEKMFEESSNFPFGGGNKHVGIIWALETLAWCPDYLLKITELLMKLAILDSGGRMNPRPQECLTSIYLPWFSQTTASVEQKLFFIRRAFDISKCIALKFCVSLLPNNHGYANHNPTPKWRDWYPDDWRKHERKDYEAMTMGVLGIIDEFASSDIDLFLQLLDSYDRMSLCDDYASRRMRRLVLSINLTASSNEQKRSLWDKIRMHISRYRELLPEGVEEHTDIQELENLYNRITPVDLFEKYSWLFSNDPSILNIPNIHRDNSFQETINLVERERFFALTAIVSQKGIQGIIEFCAYVKDSSFIGYTLASLDIPNKDEIYFIEKSLSGGMELPTNPNALGAGLSYLRSRIDRNKALISQYMSCIELNNPEYSTCIAFVLHKNSSAFSIIDTVPEDQKRIFWSRINIYHLPIVEMQEYIINNLVAFKQPIKAIDYFNLLLHEYRGRQFDFPFSLVISMLTNGINAVEKGIDFQSLRLHIENILSWLDNTIVDRTEIARLEWLYYEIIESSNRGPRELIRFIGSSPKFFVDLIDLLNTPNRDELEDSRLSQLNANRSFALLHKWNVPPGTEILDAGEKEFEGDIVFPNGTIDYSTLIAWVSGALEIASSVNKKELAESFIGEILAFTPKSDEGIWPCEPVCKFLEEAFSDRIQRSLHIAIRNKRGMISRAHGGEQERQLVRKFTLFHDAIPLQYQQARELLRELIQYYRDLATWEDDASENMEFGNY